MSNKEKIQDAVQTLYGKVFNEGRADLLPGLIAGPYIQHNPRFPNDPDPLMGYLKQAGLPSIAIRSISQGMLQIARSSFIAIAGVALAEAAAFTLAPSTAFAQASEFTKIESRVSRVAANVYMIDATGGYAGGNIGVSVGEDGILIVDDQFAELADKIAAALKGITDKPVRYVINTHYHSDHTDGNAIFGQKAVIISHDNLRKRLEAGQDLEFEDKDFKPLVLPKQALPIITYDHSLTVHVNGEEIRAINYPHAHTNGDSVVWFTASNVVCMGDEFFNGMFPIIDLAGGGSVKGLTAAINDVIQIIKPDTKIIPGHGPIGTVGDLKSYLAMLTDSYAIVRAGLKQGKSVERLQKDHALARYDKYSQGFLTADEFIELLAKDIQGRQGELAPY